MPVDEQRSVERMEQPTEPGAAGPGAAEEDRPGGDRITVGSGDENVAKIQLAARWAEAFAPPDDDSLEDVLRRFYRSYAYIDAVTHNVTPEEA